MKMSTIQSIKSFLPTVLPSTAASPTPSCGPPGPLRFFGYPGKRLIISQLVSTPFSIAVPPPRSHRLISP